ncbi:MAG: M50 family metallopeptidase [Candidatus Limnocylindria bacterium]
MLGIFGDIRTLLIFLVTFTVIIAVHELGHYITARLLGMRVLEFAFGFPPRLFAWRHAGIDYSVNAIPFGGFVRILGQEDFAIRQQGEGEPGSFTSKPWWAQAIVLVAGVTMNFILALVVLTVAFLVGTTAPTGDVRILEVKEGSPAAAAEVRDGDLIREIDGTAFRSSAQIVTYVYRQAGLTRAGVPVDPPRSPLPMTLVLERDGRLLDPVTVTPRQELPPGEGPTGIVLEDVAAPISVSPAEAVVSAWALTADVVGQIAALPGQLLGAAEVGPAGQPQIGGPIEIFRVTGQVAEFGFPALLRLVGVLSINLGVINIIPFPALDGGRLLFVLVGGIFRKRLSPQVEAMIHAVGFLLLLGLLVLVSIADLRRVFGES